MMRERSLFFERPFMFIALTLLTVHGFLMLFVLFQMERLNPQKKMTPKLVMKTVSLNPTVQPSAPKTVKAPKVEAPPKKPEIVKKKPQVKKPNKKPAVKKQNKNPPKKQTTPKKETPDQTELAKSFEKIQASLGQLALADSSSKELPDLGQVQVSAKNRASPEEIKYIDLLATKLRASLRLPDADDVQIELTLKRNGDVKKLSIVHSGSDANENVVQNKIPSMRFPAFDNYIKNEQTYTFKITLRGDA